MVRESVLVTVVEIGDVGVRVRDGLVDVPVGMPHRRRQLGMRVGVMAVIVPVAVRVLDATVRVHVATRPSCRGHRAAEPIPARYFAFFASSRWARAMATYSFATPS